MSAGEDHQWLYYKIYAGSAAGKIDYLLTGSVPQIACNDDVTSWFFLHHTDEGGPHLRLRLRTAAMDRVRLVVEPALNDALADLPMLPPNPYRPTILPPSLPPADGQPARFNGVRVELEHYEPDADSFGERGVRIAEDLFCVSSDVALQIIIDEQDHKYSRKTLAPLLMQATADAFVPDLGRQIWTDYASYWLEWNPELRDQWLSRFVAKAAELRARAVPVLAADEQLPAEALEPLRAWRAATAAAATAFAAVDDWPARPSEDLTFRFCHAMNNRLGLNPIEEAYLATLIVENVRDNSVE